MAEVATADGVPPSTGQSPFAIARGRRSSASCSGTTERRFTKLWLRPAFCPLAPRDSPIFGEDERRASSRFTTRRSQGRPNCSSACYREGKGRHHRIRDSALARLIMLPETILVSDVVAVTRERKAPVLVVGEIKTYSRPRRPHGWWRAGSGARASGRLRAWASYRANELGLAASISVASEGFLVLSRPA